MTSPDSFSSSAVPLSQLCYDIAYFILPPYVFNDPDRITDLCLRVPDVAGPFFYLLACQLRQIEPDPACDAALRWHHGQFDENHEYFALQYPVPSPIDLSTFSPDAHAGDLPPIVLAPHFSALLREKKTSRVRYFILGQAPFGGGTTLRTILPDQSNCNLGPGPQPLLPDFLEAIRFQLEQTDRSPAH